MVACLVQAADDNSALPVLVPGEKYWKTISSAWRQLEDDRQLL